MSAAINGEAFGAIKETTMVIAIGNKIRKVRESFVREYGMRMQRSFLLVINFITGGLMIGINDI
jgi:hypothetical protein